MHDGGIVRMLKSGYTPASLLFQAPRFPGALKAERSDSLPGALLGGSEREVEKGNAAKKRYLF